MYATNKTTHRRHASKSLEQFKQLASVELAHLRYCYAQNPVPKTAQLRVMLELICTSERQLKSIDVDNHIKAALDCVATALGINDNQVYGLFIGKQIVNPFDSGICIEVAIYE